MSTVNDGLDSMSKSGERVSDVAKLWTESYKQFSEKDQEEEPNSLLAFPKGL